MLLSLSQMDVLLLKIERNDSKFQVKFHLHVCKFDCCSSSLLDAILVGVIFVFGISILNFLTKTVTFHVLSLKLEMLCRSSYNEKKDVLFFYVSPFISKRHYSFWQVLAWTFCFSMISI